MKGKNDEILFSLLRSALWGEEFREKLSQEEFSQVLRLAKEQTVVGLVFDILKDAKIEGTQNKRLIFETLGLTEGIKHQNQLINRELVSFTQRCEEVGLDYMVVKGQTYSILYPKPELRMTGDIDFLVRQEYLDVREVLIKELSIALPEIMKEQEIGFNRNGILYELHTSLRTWAKRNHQKVWDALMEREWQKQSFVEIDGVKVRTLSPTLNAVYVFIHLFFHFIREGVSLRQLCDWMIVLHYYKDEIDKDLLQEMLSDLDVFDAYGAFGTILVDHLGLPANEFPMPLDDNNRKWKGKISKDIFGGGNFGKLHHKVNISWKFKMETMRLVVRNTFRYYRLCPSEIGGMIPRLVKTNLRLLVG